jgi:hypothetical protein
LCFVKKSIVILKSLESLKLQTNLKTTKEFEYNFETRFEKRRRENLLNFWAQPKTLSSFFFSLAWPKPTQHQPTLAQPHLRGLFAKSPHLLQPHDGGKLLGGSTPAAGRSKIPAATPGGYKATAPPPVNPSAQFPLSLSSSCISPRRPNPTSPAST